MAKKKQDEQVQEEELLLEAQKDRLPEVFKFLFPKDGEPEEYEKALSLVTEIPPRMVMPLLRMYIAEAALDPNRTEPLPRIFRRAFQQIMVSVSRRGRKEALAMAQSLAAEEEEEEAVI